MSEGTSQAAVQAMMRYDANKKSMAVSYLLWIFLGGFGGHRFYHGLTGSAAAQVLMTVFGILFAAAGVGLFLLIPLWIWVLVDAFLIPGWVREHNNRLATSLGA
jgi:TM2 domain-containing membrane protein YozV